MTSLLTLLNRFENAAGVYERSDDPAARDELHAARRAIVEAFKAQEAALEHAREKMWTYGFPEDDLQPIRAALSRLTP